MKTASFLALPALGLAFPSALNGPELEERQLISTLLGDVKSMLGQIATGVDESDFRPEPGYEFQAPSPSDSRGPCPGLNLLANHGYLPRSGLVTLPQVVEATSRGFNMASDLSTILSVFAVMTDGDIKSQSFYLGTGPGHLGGLNRHDTVETDISPGREDFYNGCGDAHHLSSRIFKQNVQIAAASQEKQFTLDVMSDHFAGIAAFSQKYNPYLYYFPFPSIVSIGAFVFYPNFFSNGTWGQGGVANYESISSIMGAQLNNQTGQFEYVPERFPAQGWYRRNNPYGALITLEQGLQYPYAKHPVGMPIGQIGTPNENAKTMLCDAVLGFQSTTPLMLAGQEESVEEAITWALDTLAGAGLDGTVLGCPSSVTNVNYLYPNASQPGGPLNPPPAVVANTGNNTYGKAYFCNAPTSPVCSPVC